MSRKRATSSSSSFKMAAAAVAAGSGELTAAGVSRAPGAAPSAAVPFAAIGDADRAFVTSGMS